MAVTPYMMPSSQMASPAIGSYAAGHRELDNEQCPMIGSFLGETSKNAISMVFTRLPDFINLIWVSQFGNVAQVAAVGLGNCLQNSIGLAIAFGLNGAFDVFASTSVVDKKVSICYLSRGHLTTTIYFLIIFPIFWYTENIFLFFRQDPMVSSYAAQYNRTALVGLWFLFQANGFQRFLINQGKAKYCTIVQLTTVPLHFLWSYLFVGVLGWGNYGLGFANSLTWIIQFICFITYFLRRYDEYGMKLLCFASNLSKWKVLRGMGDYVRVAIPSAIQCASDWVWWEMLVLIVGLLGDERQLAAHVVVFNFCTLIASLSSAICVSTSSVVGKAIGRGSKELAIRLEKIALSSTAVILFIVCFVSFIFAPQIAALFSHDDDETLILTKNTLRIASVSIFFSGSENVVAGIMRLCRRSKYIAIMYVFQNFVLTFALVLFLSFYFHGGVYGVWVASSVGSFLGLLFSLILCSRIDLQTEIDEAKARMQFEQIMRTPLL